MTAKFTGLESSTRPSHQEEFTGQPQQGKWMAWAVDLYVPQDAAPSGGKIGCAVCMWIASATLIVPLAVFLFAAIADCCCCCCNAEEETEEGTRRFDIITSSPTKHALSTEEIQRELVSGLTALYQSQKFYTPLIKEKNPVCSLLNLEGRSDADLLAEVQSLYTNFRKPDQSDKVAADELDTCFYLNQWLQEQAGLTVTAQDGALFGRLLDIVRHVTSPKRS